MMKLTIPKLIILVALIVLGFFGYKYYAETYAGQEAYAVVPNEVPAKEPTRDSAGKVQTGVSSYNYTLTFVKKDGTKDTREVEISGENPTPLTPNSFVKAKLSKKRITEGPSEISKKDIPANLLAKLEQN